MHFYEIKNPDNLWNAYWTPICHISWFSNLGLVLNFQQLPWIHYPLFCSYLYFGLTDQSKYTVITACFYKESKITWCGDLRTKFMNAYFLIFFFFKLTFDQTWQLEAIWFYILMFVSPEALKLPLRERTILHGLEALFLYWRSTVTFQGRWTHCSTAQHLSNLTPLSSRTSGHKRWDREPLVPNF